jgi:hypothetical protein
MAGRLASAAHRAHSPDGATSWKLIGLLRQKRCSAIWWPHSRRRLLRARQIGNVYAPAEPTPGHPHLIRDIPKRSQGFTGLQALSVASLMLSYVTEVRRTAILGDTRASHGASPRPTPEAARRATSSTA